MNWYNRRNIYAPLSDAEFGSLHATGGSPKDRMASRWEQEIEPYKSPYQTDLSGNVTYTDSLGGFQDEGPVTEELAQARLDSARAARVQHGVGHYVGRNGTDQNSAYGTPTVTFYNHDRLSDTLRYGNHLKGTPLMSYTTSWNPSDRSIGGTPAIHSGTPQSFLDRAYSQRTIPGYNWADAQRAVSRASDSRARTNWDALRAQALNSPPVLDAINPFGQPPVPPVHDTPQIATPIIRNGVQDTRGGYTQFKQTAQIPRSQWGDGYYANGTWNSLDTLDTHTPYTPRYTPSVYTPSEPTQALITRNIAQAPNSAVGEALRQAYSRESRFKTQERARNTQWTRRQPQRIGKLV